MVIAFIRDLRTNSMKNNGEKGTFVIKIERCQNETWQGKLTWADENKSIAFRSALELMKLMNEAMVIAKSQNQMVENHSVS